MKNESGVTFGLAAVRITWITAFVICVLSILSGLLSGTDGGGSSQQLPGLPFVDGGDAPQLLPEFLTLTPAQAVATNTRTAASRDDPSRRIKEQAPRGSDYGTRAPNRTGSQPEDSGGGTPPGTSRPNPPHAPTDAQQDPPRSPSVTSPSRPQEPSGNPTPSQPTVQPTVEMSVAESEVSVSASQESVSAQVKTPVVSTDVTIGLS
jgi:hypothetical protein